MKTPFPVFIGLRYSSARRGDQLVSFLSGISITGLVVGVALLVVVLSVMNGFDRELREKILSLVPQAAIKHRQGIEDWQSLTSTLKEDPRIVAAAPFVQQMALVSFNKKTEAVVLYGIDPQQEKAVSEITRYVDEARLAELEAVPSILLGAAVARKIGVTEKDRLLVVVPNANASIAPEIQYLQVLGIIQSNTELDNSLALTSLALAAQLSGSPDEISGIRLKLNDLFDAPDVVYDNLVKLGPGYTGSNWTRTHGNIYHAIQMSKNLVGLLMSLIVGIAAFNVVSTLVMVVVDKQGDIAILRTLGAGTKSILAIFIVQGSLIGLFGTLMGIAVGCLLALGVQDFVQILESLLNYQFLKSDVYPLTYLPTEIRMSDLVRVFLTSFSLCFLATLFPAWKASRFQPADALRYE
ncbi:lipoprotein-releasing system permease protein [Alteromonadaceae bacterium Bs31]|nr:lipoprotein-releasing system permease protein [Alteromonadaceae bacterium Bs31]